jgi:threonine dehydrogenase-like Zn-dependent dehydrogenase
MAVDPAAAARTQAMAWGAAESVAPSDLGPAEHASVGLVVEATGRPDGLTLAAELTGTGGTLGILGYHQSEAGERTVDMRAWNYRALRVLNLHHRDRTDVVRWMGQAQRLSALGVVRPGELVRARVGLADLPSVFVGDGPRVKTMVDLSAAPAVGSAS